MKPFPIIPGCTLYLCGGAVRDEMLGVEYKDRDFVVKTDATFREFVDDVLPGMGAEVYLEDEKHLTARALIGREAIDLVFPRGEGAYADHRHPGFVTRVNSLQDDALRRDFTINSMFLNEYAELIDYYDGLHDLQNQRIRAVGDPNARFGEDALRVLRAIRFACRFNFEIDGDTWAAMQLCSVDIQHVSADRVRGEIDMALGYNAELAFAYAQRLNLFPTFQKLGVNFMATQKAR